MDFSKENEIKRRYLKNDFSDMKRLMSRIRTALVTGKPLTLAGLKLDNIIKFRGDNQDFVISIFQKNVKSIRMISKRKTLEDVLNRIIVRLRAHERFCEFDIKNPASSRILIEWITKKEKTDIKKLHLEGGFDKYRFEAGITGLEAVKDNKSYIWFPTDSPVKNEKNLAPVLANLGDRMGYTNNRGLNTIEKGIEVRKIEDVDFYLLESNAFVTYMDDIIPLYRGNVIYEEYNKDMLFEVFQKSSDYLVSNLKENGQFVYYYNPTADNNIDHEHPSRKEDDLYYNDLRHSGAVIVLIKKYEYTKDEALLEKIKLAINYIISITKFHDDNKAYVYLNQKGKLGGVGISLVMLLKYRTATNDTSYDKYIEAYSRHILSRLTDDGEFLCYYIHPFYNNAEPIINPSYEDKKKLFSFYYPGEALLGLALCYLNYDKNDELKNEIYPKAKKAMDWIINERPKQYSELFEDLPSDSWLMQAIEEWAKVEGFLNQEAIDFVFNDAKKIIELTYKKDDSPYIDYEGGMYKKYGDHYYLSAQRSEGMIAAYYLAKFLHKEDLAQVFLNACKKEAKCEFQLFISDKNNFAHLNPDKSYGGVKFKATRQWLRIDSIQHVSCFFDRLYQADN